MDNCIIKDAKGGDKYVWKGNGSYGIINISLIKV